MKLLYKPFGLIVSVIGGILAGAIFKQVWKLVAHEEDTPDSTDVQKSWAEVLIAATIQGAIFAVVKAAVDRAGAEATLKLTGVWPGTDSAAEAEKEREKQAKKEQKKRAKAHA
jgi:predicted metal-dependent enzyme (double-stranded beta helix superfamily)